MVLMMADIADRRCISKLSCSPTDMKRMNTINFQLPIKCSIRLHAYTTTLDYQVPTTDIVQCGMDVMSLE